MGFISSLIGNASSVSSEKLQEKYAQLLIQGEQIEVGFNVFRDTFIFTNKRLILVDVQGITGKKIEYLTIPYSKVTRFSVESAGHLDLDGELKIWIASESLPSIRKKFNTKVNIYEIQKILAHYTL